MPTNFLSPPISYVTEIQKAIRPQIKHKYRFGYEVEFSSPNARAVYDYIRRSGHNYIDEWTSNAARLSRWQVKHDRSIQPEAGHTGVEIASAPMSLEHGIASLFCAFDYINETGGVTNNSCGLHVSISFTSTDAFKKLNPLALLCSFDEESYLTKWGRKDNRYCQLTFKAVNGYIKNSLADYAREMNHVDSINSLCCYIGNAITKHHGVNLIKLSNSYIEFRIMGGADYHKKREQVLDTIMAIIKALDFSVGAETPKVIADEITSIEGKCRKTMEEFKERITKASEYKKHNRGLLGELHKNINQMKFIRDAEQRRAMETIIFDIKSIMNRDSDQYHLQDELIRIEQNLKSVIHLKKNILQIKS